MIQYPHNIVKERIIKLQGVVLFRFEMNVTIIYIPINASLTDNQSSNPQFQVNLWNPFYQPIFFKNWGLWPFVFITAYLFWYFQIINDSY
jgi:hypothetical protein